MTPDEASALEAIRQTMARYNIAGDRLKLDELAATFTEDGVLEEGPQDAGRIVRQGRAAIAAGLREGVARMHPGGKKPSFVRHHLTTSLLECVSPDEARGRTYFEVYTDIGPDHAGVYIDRFRKVDGRWLIAHREVRIDWVADNAIFHPGLKEWIPKRRGARASTTPLTAQSRSDS